MMPPAVAPMLEHRLASCLWMMAATILVNILNLALAAFMLGVLYARP